MNVVESSRLPRELRNSWVILRCGAGEDGEDQLDGSCKKMRSMIGSQKSNILHTVKTRKANRIGHTLSWHCFQKHVTEGKIDRMREFFLYFFERIP